ncbi:MAG TPA: hypothetical protein PLE33_08910 [Candidatus Cloacimonas sp.]|nr:hypothetical protein [Candidatus Cloacimonas sp.]
MTDTLTSKQAAIVFDSEINRLERLTRNAGLIIQEIQQGHRRRTLCYCMGV